MHISFLQLVINKILLVIDKILLYFAKLKYDFMLGKFVSQNSKKYVIHFAVNLVNF